MSRNLKASIDINTHRWCLNILQPSSSIHVRPQSIHKFGVIYILNGRHERKSGSKSEREKEYVCVRLLIGSISEEISIAMTNTISINYCYALSFEYICVCVWRIYLTHTITHYVCMSIGWSACLCWKWVRAMKYKKKNRMYDWILYTAFLCHQTATTIITQWWWHRLKLPQKLTS